ncbi:MAG TPA: Druantia anti-phage system protein DruA [Acidimicrobiales bacterium]|jgi:hypothetical protein|nr:Druantia anti-phage system protein DruA [Acidimicrobiales bacterium]
MVNLSELRRMVIGELMAAGFESSGGLLVPPADSDKQSIRALHQAQRSQVLAKAANFIETWENRVLGSFADGDEVDPEQINPAVVQVTTEEEAAIFRYASLHWSVPVSQGYGRRTRFLIMDQSNGKLIGIFALGDPVFNLKVRDDLIGWGPEQRKRRLYNVFDAFVLGAVEPYRQLIGGKLAALCAVSDETRIFLKEKYDGTRTIIDQQVKIATPVLITTTSALGRSSVYNRLTFGDRKVLQPIGFTEGFGHFQFSDDVFTELVELARRDDPRRGNEYGDGPNWKMRTIRSSLQKLGLSGNLLKHGIKREVFIAPLSFGWRAFLRGETDVIRPVAYPLGDISRYYSERWAIPRAQRMPGFRSWDHHGMRLSSQMVTLRR